MKKEEYLCMSIPHKIMIQWLREDDNTYQISQLSISDAPFLLSKKHKPICRPLSDLTKPIEHNGEKFIPIERLLEDITNAWRLCKLDYPNNSKGLYNDIISNIEACEFWLIQNLVEWHFDIADLISKGEAIDVNTLEINPYK